MKQDPARRAISNRVHLSQDDGNKQTPGLVSDFSLTLESSSDAVKRKKTPKKVSQRPQTDEIIVWFNKPIFGLFKPHGNQQIQKMKTRGKKLRLFFVTLIIQIKRTKPRPVLKDEQSRQDWMEDQEKLQLLKARQSFLRNPRFLPLNAQQGATSLIQPRNKAAQTVNVTSERYSESLLCSRVCECCQIVAIYEGLCSIPAKAPLRLLHQSF